MSPHPVASPAGRYGIRTNGGNMDYYVVTLVDAEVLRAALKRNGVWFVCQCGNTTNFYHKSCFSRELHETRIVKQV
jgi:hypothetical protein